MRYVSSLAVILAGVFGSVFQLNAADSKLLDAIRTNDNERVSALLSEGADPNFKDSNQVSALMYAALYAGPSVLDRLIGAGADLNYRDGNGLTALTWAVYSYESAKVLINAGAGVNSKSNLGVTPFLTAAAYPGNTPLLRLMLQKGADIKMSVLGGATALTVAALTGDTEGATLLLQNGADPSPVGPGGFSPLFLAVMRGDRGMVKALLDGGASLDIRTSYGEDVLERYGSWNDPALVKMLLERGIDPARKDKRGHNSLLFAAASDTVTPEVFSMLLKGAPSTDARTAYGDNALQMAQRRGDVKIAGLLGGTVPRIEPRAFAEIRPVRQQIQAAVSGSLELLARTGPSVVNKMGCFSCHHQGLPSLAASYARRAGIEAAQIAEVNRKLVYSALQHANPLMQHGVAPAGEAATVAWQLIGLASDGQPADLFTDVAVNYIAATQLPDGHWPERSGRPPLEYSTVAATALAIRALDLYRLPGRPREFDERIARASAWLARTEPVSPEEDSLRLLGLVWGKAPPPSIGKAARELASAQRPNGGWAQLPSLGTDAYATGQALVALCESGQLHPESPAFVRGVKYLLGTREPDGSWHVSSRSLPVQPLFESGFPHGRDQWISAAGTSWAVMALSLAIPPR